MHLGVLVVVVIAGLLFGDFVEGQPTVDTTHGTVEGFRQTVIDKYVDTYFGIPFAMPPIGTLRFQRPADLEAWNGTLKVQTPHNSCYVYVDTMFERIPGVEMWNPNTNMSEDCLYLNIWVPRGASIVANKPMATMVWIFGGGFFSGTPTLDVYNGKYLAAYTDVIVVSLNYRTGPLGFMYMGTNEVPGNMGLLDQQMALRWVFRNIERFGGDKTRITLFGESAGAASAALHSFSDGSKDYFTRVILQSSAPVSYWTLTPTYAAEERAKQLAINLDCPVTNKKATLKCFMERSAAELSKEQFSASWTGFLPVPFSPVIDGEFLQDDPRKLIEQGNFKQTDTLLGVVKDEGTYWLIYGLREFYPFPFPKVFNTTLSRTQFERGVDSLLSSDNKYVRKAAIALYSDSVPSLYRDTYRDILDDIMGDTTFKCPVIKYGLTVSKYNAVYLYSFNERMKSLPWPEWTGVPHGYEIETVFGLPLDPALGYTSAEVKLSKKVMSYWTNFAKTGNPNGINLPYWPVYNESSQNYAILDSTTTDYIQSGLRSLQCHFWSSIAPLIKNTDNTPTDNPDGRTCTNGSTVKFRISSLFFINVITVFIRL